MNDNKTNLIYISTMTSLDISPDRVLLAAVGQLKDAIVIGEDKNNEFYFASSKANHRDILCLLETAKEKLQE